MNEVIELKVLADNNPTDYRIWLKFNDGENKIVDLRPFLGKGFTVELLDSEKFKQVFIEPGGGIAWPNGYDFCPNFLKKLSSISEVAAATA